MSDIYFEWAKAQGMRSQCAYAETASGRCCLTPKCRSDTRTEHVAELWQSRFDSRNRFWHLVGGAEAALKWPGRGVEELGVPGDRHALAVVELQATGLGLLTGDIILAKLH